jgi:hypothetical protein
MFDFLVFLSIEKVFQRVPELQKQTVVFDFEYAILWSLRRRPSTVTISLNHVIVIETESTSGRGMK